jgi:glutathione S-transferase
VLLIGMLDSPFVRRVAVSMQLLGMTYEHRAWSVGRDFERIHQYNPMVKVPTLVLDEEEVLSDSSAILDYLDQSVGTQRALLPPSGRPRRDALRLIAIALFVADKARDQLQEVHFRPEDKRHMPWVTRLQGQMHEGLQLLDAQCRRRDGEPWMLDGGMTQADITATCAYTFASEALPHTAIPGRYPHLEPLAMRCEALEPFRNTHTPFFKPVG